MAKNDSLDVRDLFKKESINAKHWQPLLRDNAYFTTYDYMDLLVDEATLDIYRSQPVLKTKDEVFQQALDTIKHRIQQHAYDDDTLMMMACTMDAIVNELSMENNMSSIREKAKNWNVSVDKAFRKDAIWCYHHKKDKKRFINEETLVKALDSYRIEHNIRNNKASLESIIQKHNEFNLPLRIIINRDIEWVRQTQIK
jgi:hypothetical protein